MAFLLRVGDSYGTSIVLPACPNSSRMISGAAFKLVEIMLPFRINIYDALWVVVRP